MKNNKIKIFVLGQDQLKWSIDKDRQAIIYFLKKNNFELVDNIFKANYIFCVWYNLLFSPRWLWLKLYKKIFNKKIIAVITNNIIDHQENVAKLKGYADLLITPSTKVNDFLKSKGFETLLIPFYVDPEIFKKIDVSKEEICQRLNINQEKIKDKIVIGSLQRDSLGSDLTKPKWQKNPALLIEILKKLPKDKYILLLAGPRRHYLVNQCQKNQIDYLYVGNENYIKEMKDDVEVNNLSLETINLLYNLIDIYIISSKSEGGPKAVVEAALTKTLIFSTDVGLARDFLASELIYKSCEEAVNKIINLGKDRQEEYKKNNYSVAKEKMNKNLITNEYNKII